MKKLILMMMLMIASVCVNAQILRTEELESYSKEKYGDNWLDASVNIFQTMELDKNNGITYVQVIECPKQSKSQLYVKLNYWVTASFNDANSVIQLNDKELGVIIVQGCVSNVASHTGGMNHYNVSIRPIIKCDIKDEKIRVTYSIQNYDVVTAAGGGAIGILAGTRPTNVSSKWLIDKCFPCVAKDSHKQTSAKAFVMSHAYSNVIMDKIEEAVANGLIGNENDEW